MKKWNSRRNGIESNDIGSCHRAFLHRYLFAAAILAAAGLTGAAGCGSTQGAEDVAETELTAADGCTGNETED
ncbi:MAG: hypothetical protein NC548_54830, partial [Lachnospiraceae bacterium]|nr:hypothetical protein [Lachnospiraceae bacterium]